MKLLVLTSAPITSPQLRDVLGGDVNPQEAEVMVVAPAVQDSGIRFWMSDADEAIAKAKAVRSATVEQLDADGVAATGDTGESDPVTAIQDALQTFPADRIVVFIHGAGDQGYREDIEAAEIEERFGVPVVKATVSA